MPRAVVTGCAGFVGSNLTRELLMQGWAVVGIDNFATGSREVVGSVSNDRFTFVEGDIRDKYTLSSLFEPGDVVFHVAALPRVQYSTDYPLESNDANVNGTLNVLEAARTSGVSRVVYSASSSMYGGEDVPFPTPETTPARPRSNYALQKHTGLEYCRLYSELYGLDTVSLIYFNLYGPGQTASNAYAGAVPAFFSAAMKGESCRIDGTGEQSRDWTYIQNAVDANILAGEADKRLNGEFFNIGCGECYSVLDVAQEVRGYMKGALGFYHGPPRAGDPFKSHADITKAREVLGYTPRVGFYEGMARTGDWWAAGCPLEFENE